MKNQEIMELIRCFDASGLEVMKLSDGGFSLELSRSPYPVSGTGSVSIAGSGAPVAPTSSASAAASQRNGSVIPAQAEAGAAFSYAADQKEVIVSAEEEGLKDLTAPLVGTFYAAPAPDQPAYVKVGDQVKKGDTLCLIEAMKMMNEIKAPCDCIIREIMVENASLVEYGKTMMRYIPC